MQKALAPKSPHGAQRTRSSSAANAGVAPQWCSPARTAARGAAPVRWPRSNCRGGGRWLHGPLRALPPVRPKSARPARTSFRSGSALVNSAWRRGRGARRRPLTENDPAKLEWGMDVELTMIPFATDADGNEIVTFAFQPV